MNADLAADHGDDNYDEDDAVVVVDQDAAIDEHPLVVAVRDGAEGVELLRAVQVHMARAAAELAFLDEHRFEFEQDALLERGRAVTRSVRAVKRLTEMELSRIRRFGTQPSDLHADPQVRFVLGLLIDRIAEVGRDVLPASKAHELDTKIRSAIGADSAVPWP